VKIIEYIQIIIYLNVNKVHIVHYENTHEDYHLFEGFFSKKIIENNFSMKYFVNCF